MWLEKSNGFISQHQIILTYNCLISTRLSCIYSYPLVHLVSDISSILPGTQQTIIWKMPYVMYWKLVLCDHISVKFPSEYEHSLSRKIHLNRLSAIWPQCINSVRTSDTHMIYALVNLAIIGSHNCYSASSHYLNQCCLILKWVVRTCSKIWVKTRQFTLKNDFEIVAWETAAILSRPQCLNGGNYLFRSRSLVTL